MKYTRFPTSWHLTLMILISRAVSSHGRVGGRKTTMEHLAAINAHYIDPGTPLEASRRGMCNGFKQTETLKGTWVPHQDPLYRGMTSVPKCPAFARDYDCGGDYIEKQYQPLAAQEYNQVFRPYGCELHPMNAQHFTQCLQGKRVIMIGDSTMRQMFQSLACLLGDHIQDGFLQDWNHANESHIHIPFEREYLINQTPGHHIYKQFVGGFLLPNRMPVYLRSFGVLNLTLWDDVMGEFMPLTSNDIIIAEFGAWYPRFDDEMALESWQRYTADMRLLFGARLRDMPATVLWRTYSPSHFGGELGTYLSTKENFGVLDLDVCQPASKGEYFFDTEIIHYLQRECGSACSHIHVLPIYHLSLPRTNSHHGSFGSGVKERRIDCRHFCTNVIDVWNQVLYNKLCFS